jgi:uncharacterized protein (TIGR03083 family)
MAASDWVATRDALAETAQRFAHLLAAVRNPEARAVGNWNVGDVAAHVREVAILNSLFATGGTPPNELREVYDWATATSVDQVQDMNALALTVLTERSPHVLAPRIEQQVAQMLDATAEVDGSEPMAWLGGLKLPVKAVLAHMLSELLVHGSDIARAEGRPFPIARADAQLVFDGFLLELLRSPDAARFAGDRATTMRPVTCELRLRGSEPVFLVVEDRGVMVEAPGARPVDVRISADPAAMWLLMFRRISPMRASLEGGVIVWGRRPWRLRRLVQVLRTA